MVDSSADSTEKMIMISLAMIVRNEERRIRRVLDSVKYAVGEMIVVDTGSTDETAAAARECGARVISHPFQNDFSDARNVSLAACRGEWILVMDADEFFPLSPKLMIDTAVEGMLGGASNEYKGYYLLRHNYEEDANTVTYSDYVMRLFRNVPNVRYRWRVHETVEDSLDATNGRYGRLTTIPLSHYLFEREENYLNTKRTLYLTGLLKDIEEHPRDPGRYDFLGCEYVRAGQWPDAERAFQKAVDLDPENAGARESLEAVKQFMRENQT